MPHGRNRNQYLKLLTPSCAPSQKDNYTELDFPCGRSHSRVDYSRSKFYPESATATIPPMIASGNAVRPEHIQAMRGMTCAGWVLVNQAPVSRTLSVNALLLRESVLAT
jgi:hypothetical protein